MQALPENEIEVVAKRWTLILGHGKRENNTLVLDVDVAQVYADRASTSSVGVSCRECGPIYAVYEPACEPGLTVEIRIVYERQCVLQKVARASF